MKISYKILLIPFLILGFGCTDLDEELKSQLNENQEVKNPGFGISANSNTPVPNDGLGPAYSTLLTGTANHNSYFSVTEVSTDEAVITQKGGDWFDGGIWLNMHRHNFLPTNDGLNGAWVDNYRGIFQCNNLLVNGTAEGPLNTEQEASVRALRAYIFWRLMDLFGNIKLTQLPEVDVPQSTRTEAFDFIEEELLDAIPDLPTSEIYGRMNQYAAYALLARLYLNAEVYTGT
ncbi:MAG TPA: RagB/SusD family nutrient uptake outer membrane protein, partial [Bacteroidales bacterium]|nr:RagB/SusD family nutrient uptake outer membrane protein [Bacteroidales bacterium]